MEPEANGSMLVRRGLARLVVIAPPGPSQSYGWYRDLIRARKGRGGSKPWGTTWDPWHPVGLVSLFSTGRERQATCRSGVQTPYVILKGSFLFHSNKQRSQTQECSELLLFEGRNGLKKPRIQTFAMSMTCLNEHTARPWIIANIMETYSQNSCTIRYLNYTSIWNL